MPIFLDFHPGTELSVSYIKEFLRAAQRGALDEHGVRPLELFCGDEGRVFCVHEAGSEAAVRRRHRGLGLPCRDVSPVAGLSGAPALSEECKARLQRATAARQAQLERVGDPVPGWLAERVG